MGTSFAGELRTVIRVVDGDTVILDGKERVRLIGVDTPETVHPSKPVENYGKEASAFTKSMCEGKQVILEYDVERQDKYGRTLAYVYLTDGTFLNAEIVKQGYGHAYTRFPFKYLEEFRQYEREAREGKKGLWAVEDDIVILKYNNSINDLKVEVIWRPDRLMNGFVLGPAIIELKNEQKGGRSSVVNNDFGLPESLLNKFIKWRKNEKGENEIMSIASQVIYLDYVAPELAKEKNTPIFTNIKVPFFFYDLDFDGKEELLIVHKFIGQRWVDIFRAYKLDTSQDFSVLEDSFLQITYEEPFMFLDELSQVDEENKTVIINLSGGVSGSEFKTYKIDLREKQGRFPK